MATKRLGEDEAVAALVKEGVMAWRRGRPNATPLPLRKLRLSKTVFVAR